MNLISAPSFESAGTWSYLYQAERSTDNPRRGTYSLKLIADNIDESEATQNMGTFAVGTLLDVSMFWWIEDFGTGVPATIRIDPGTGVYETLNRVPPIGGLGAPAVPQWVYYSSLVEVTGTGNVILSLYSGKALFFGSSTFYVDDVYLGESVITTTLKNALVSDLQDIDGTGVYSTTVAEVGTEPKRRDEVRTPGVYLISAGGRSDPGTFTNIRRASEQTFVVRTYISSSTPNADSDLFLDDVRNCVERSAGNLRNVSGVHNVTASEWDKVETGTDIAGGMHSRDITIFVEYQHQSGNA